MLAKDRGRLREAQPVASSDSIFLMHAAGDSTGDDALGKKRIEKLGAGNAGPRISKTQPNLEHELRTQLQYAWALIAGGRSVLAA